MAVPSRIPREWVDPPESFGTHEEGYLAGWHTPQSRAEVVELRAATQQQDFAYVTMQKVRFHQPRGTFHEVKHGPEDVEFVANLHDFAKHLWLLDYQSLYRVLKGHTWLTEAHRADILQALAAIGDEQSGVALSKWRESYDDWTNDWDDTRPAPQWWPKRPRW